MRSLNNKKPRHPSCQNDVSGHPKPEKDDRECAESIQECLSEVGEGGREVKVPLRWHALYQKLLEVANGLGKKVLPRELCSVNLPHQRRDGR